MTFSQFITSERRRILFLAIVTILSIGGLVQGAGELTTTLAKRRASPFSFYGDNFRGLASVLKNEKYLGYFTDQDINAPAIVARFEQAQLELVPLILDPGGAGGAGEAGSSLQRKFILFDCLAPAACQEAMARAGAKPLQGNGRGLTLAVRP